ncbi:MAG: acyltransferase [Firmicutes bacterium]|nr:acyltransferase [Bacillota bacterium]
MRNYQRFEVRDKNAMQHWHRIVSPLKVVKNFAVIQIGRYCPSLTVKSWLYRLGLGMKIAPRVSIGLMVMVDIFFPEKISIGEDTTIGYNCTVLTHEYLHRSYHIGPVVIGKNVLIGANSTLLPGVTIGDNSVVAACSLVNCDVPANTTVGGVPIRVLSPNQNITSHPKVSTRHN